MTLKLYSRFRNFAGLVLAMAIGPLVSPAAPGQPSSTDLDKLQGAWSLVSARQAGKPLPPDQVKRTTIVFEGQHFLFPDSAEQATSKDGTITVDPAKKPKQMDATSSQGEVMLGIYELKGDDYKVCFAPAGKPRPAQFASTPENGNILQVWKRKKK